MNSYNVKPSLKQSFVAGLCALVLALPSFAQDTVKPDSLQELMDRLMQEKRVSQSENKQRLNEFKRNKANQQSLLNKEKRALGQEQARGKRLENTFDSNEKSLEELSEVLRQRVGNLGELFGVVRQVAGDTRGLLEVSATSAEHPERDAKLQNLAQSKALPTIPELETLWLTLHGEMTASAEVKRIKATVITPEGHEQEQDVTRVGLFNSVSNGQYLFFNGETGKFQILPRQPDSQVTDAASAFEGASAGYQAFSVDPTRGVILRLLMQSPNLAERIAQGRLVGYIILSLGAIGLLLGLMRLFQLFSQRRRIEAQIKSEQANENNPLGLLMKVRDEHSGDDFDSLERKLDEVLVGAAGQLEKGVGIIKLIATVAPLLGLLGTVIGMIGTFQAITLFGTGDPKLMAGGISEALVTTMLGLVVAVPLIFLHSLVQTRSQRLVQMLEEQSVGYIARHVEGSGR